MGSFPARRKPETAAYDAGERDVRGTDEKRRRVSDAQDDRTLRQPWRREGAIRVRPIDAGHNRVAVHERHQLRDCGFHTHGFLDALTGHNGKACRLIGRFVAGMMRRRPHRSSWRANRRRCPGVRHRDVMLVSESMNGRHGCGGLGRVVTVRARHRTREPDGRVSEPHARDDDRNPSHKPSIHTPGNGAPAEVAAAIQALLGRGLR